MLKVIINPGDRVIVMFQRNDGMISRHEISLSMSNNEIRVIHHEVDNETSEHLKCKELLRLKSLHEVEDAPDNLESLRHLFGAGNVHTMGFDPSEFAASDGRVGDQLTPEEMASAMPLVARKGGYNKVEPSNGMMVLETTERFRLFADKEGTYFLHSVAAGENRMVNPKEWERIAFVDAIGKGFEIEPALEALWVNAIAAN